MTWNVIRYATEVLINGTAVTVAGEPSISEDLDTFGTVLEFQLLSRPDPFPAEGSPVEVRRVNLETSEYISLFGGYLTGDEIESEPHAMLLRAVDELSKFAAIRTTNDLNLTGMTEGEAWQVVAGVCDVDFDPADIADSGYVLGDKAPVYWKVGTTGQSLIEELDRIFSCKTMTVLNGRVVRFLYDRVGHSADITTTYQKGVNADFGGNHYSRGDSSQVQSIWSVRGVSAPCGTDNACSCQVWALSQDVTPKRGKKITRVPTSEIAQSDLIQDEALAKALTRRYMRWYNRVPKVLTITAVTDPNMHPGRVVGVIDSTYGIGLSSTTPAFVTTVEKAGGSMTLTALAGTGGSQGTTTSGVEKRCGGTLGDLDWDGTFDFDTSFSFPPFGDWTTWLGDFDIGWSVEGGTSEGGGGVVVISSEWEADTLNEGPLTFGDGLVWGGGPGLDSYANYIGDYSAIMVLEMDVTFQAAEPYDDGCYIIFRNATGDWTLELYPNVGFPEPGNWTADAYGVGDGYEYFIFETIPNPVHVKAEYRDNAVTFTWGPAGNPDQYVWALTGTETLTEITLLAFTTGGPVKFENITMART
jgi:hypothetical protein